MANYSITLNLSGNAPKSVKRLADQLERANKNAEKLKSTLRSMPSAAGGAAGGAALTVLLGAVKVIGKFVYQFNKYNTLGGFAITKSLTDVLVSERMAEAIRYQQRMAQARAGLGEGYQRAVEQSETLAATYGLSPATTMASINTLAGLRMGGKGKQIDIDTAAAIVKVGGLISQQSGYAFERVMTNFQQLFANSVPSKRDIREMLGQAPILAKYATQEIDKRGLTGKIDMYDFYKSHANLAYGLQRFEMENNASPAALARGQVTLAQQNIYNQLALNQGWVNIAANMVNFFDSVRQAADKFLTVISKSRAVMSSINTFGLYIEQLGDTTEWLIPILDRLIDKIEDFAGVKINESESDLRTQNQQVVAKTFDESSYLIKSYIRQGLEAQFKDRIVSDDQVEGAYNLIKQRALLRGSDWIKAVQPVEGFSIQPTFRYDERSGELIPYVPRYFQFSSKMKEMRLKYPSTTEWTGLIEPKIPQFLRRNMPANEGEKWDVRAIKTRELFGLVTESLQKTVTKWGDIAGTDEADGDSLSGYNKDRRSLEIHFHAPIVEWNSEITTDSPREVVDEVAKNIEGAASRAIQVALLGASQKMSTRWY